MTGIAAADLALPLRDALVAAPTITSLLSAYGASYPVFTRRGVPPDAPFPLITISPDISITDDDKIDDFRPIQERDITVFGQNTSAAKYLAVESIAYAIRDLLHATRDTIVVPGWHLIQITARGPIPAPTDDDNLMSRLVALTIQLARKAN